MGSVFSYFFGHPGDDILDSRIGLTGREKRLVRETWNILRADSVHTGVVIMKRYFEKYPRYHQVFPAFKDIPIDELPANKKFQAHCQNIVATLSSAFDALDDVDLMNAILHIAGERHGRRGQGRQEFIDLKGVMMEVMRGALGPTFSPEVEATWSKMIDITFSKIFEGFQSYAS